MCRLKFFLLVHRKITVIVYTRGMAKLFSEKSMVIVKKYGRLFLRNTTLFFNPNPSLSQETALRRSIPCTLDTSLPNLSSNTFKIGWYQFTHKIKVYTRGMAKLFVNKKLGLVQEDKGSYGTLIFSPQPYFFSWQRSFARFYPVYTGHEFSNFVRKCFPHSVLY